MSWIAIALLAPALSAAGSYVDKYLLVHQERSGGLGSILIFSSVFGILILPIAVLLGAHPFSIPPLAALILIGNGFLTALTLATYLYAIRDSDVISVVPVLQTIPLFGFAFGFLVLGETLKPLELAGSVIVIVSAALLSFEIEEDSGARFNAKSLLWALLSACLFALSGSVFKFFATDYGYWTVQFWEYVGIAFFGLVLFFCIRAYREHFLSVIRNGNLKVIGLNFMTETIMVSADLLLNFATLLAPLALVYTVNSFQPAFLLLFGFVGCLLAPQLMQKLAFLRKHMLLKSLAIASMIAGSVLIYTA